MKRHDRIAQEIVDAVEFSRRFSELDCPAFEDFRERHGIPKHRGYWPIDHEDYAHEIAHWIVAAPERRDQIDFSLSLWDHAEENLASVLGILIEREHYLDWKHTAIEHNWKNLGVENICDVLQELRDLGHIDDDCRPMALRRAP